MADSSSVPSSSVSAWIGPDFRAQPLSLEKDSTVQILTNPKFIEWSKTNEDFNVEMAVNAILNMAKKNQWSIEETIEYITQFAISFETAKIDSETLETLKKDSTALVTSPKSLVSELPGYLKGTFGVLTKVGGTTVTISTLATMAVANPYQVMAFLMLFCPSACPLYLATITIILSNPAAVSIVCVMSQYIPQTAIASAVYLSTFIPGILKTGYEIGKWTVSSTYSGATKLIRMAKSSQNDQLLIGWDGFNDIVHKEIKEDGIDFTALAFDGLLEDSPSTTDYVVSEEALEKIREAMTSVFEISSEPASSSETTSAPAPAPVPVSILWRLLGY